MGQTLTFGNKVLGTKMREKYGAKAKTVKADTRFAQQVRQFINKIEIAHKQAAKSKLVFK
jgi:hypothetical protein